MATSSRILSRSEPGLDCVIVTHDHPICDGITKKKILAVSDHENRQTAAPRKPEIETASTLLFIMNS